MKIDIFNHVMPQAYLELVRQHSKEPGLVKRMSNLRMLWDIEHRVEMLRTKFPDVKQVLTLGLPAPELLGGPDQSPGFARVANDGMAQMCRREIVFTAGAPPFRSDPNGEFETGQMYVQWIKLISPRMPYPMLMVHGGGLTGVTWETKPDGGPGWQMYFLRAGYDVYVADAVERGRASWSRFPEIFTSEPVFRNKKEAWELFRIGPPNSYSSDPKKRVAHKGTQFPVEAFDQFAKQGVPRWATNDAATQAAYDALVQKICPCVIVVHSQGGNFMFNAALAAPDKVKAVVAIEPSGAPNPSRVDVGKLKNTPHLFVWGDYLDQPELWKKIVPAVELYRAGLVAAGVTAELVELPKLGVRGNSHMMMMDRNSDNIAKGIQDWLAKNVSR